MMGTDVTLVFFVQYDANSYNHQSFVNTSEKLGYFPAFYFLSFLLSSLLEERLAITEK